MADRLRASNSGYPIDGHSGAVLPSSSGPQNFLPENLGGRLETALSLSDEALEEMYGSENKGRRKRARVQAMKTELENLKAENAALKALHGSDKVKGRDEGKVDERMVKRELKSPSRGLRVVEGYGKSHQDLLEENAGLRRQIAGLQVQLRDGHQSTELPMRIKQERSD